MITQCLEVAVAGGFFLLSIYRALRAGHVQNDSLWDATIQGHVSCSFVALLLVDELKPRLKERGWDAERNDIRRDLQSLAEVVVSQGEDTYLLRSPLQGVAGKVLQAVGAAIPPSV